MKNTLSNFIISRQKNLSEIYMKTLSSPMPGSESGRVVAGNRIQGAMRHAKDLFYQEQNKWLEVFEVWDKNPEKVWVWSDHHLFHNNIIKFTGRPFNNPSEFASVMTQNANVINDDDFVIFGGDITFGDTVSTRQWVKSIPGKKYLIMGNHEVDRKKKIREIEKFGFVAFTDCLHLENTTHPISYITHYPLFENFIPDNVFNVHGHIHEKKMQGDKYINMCVEHTNYSPVKLIDMLSKASKSNTFSE